MATTVSFINFKGGVGKTTLCVEIAAALASKFNSRVLLVDLDPQTNATLSLLTENEWEKHSTTKGTLRDYFAACYDKKDFDLSSIIYQYKKHPSVKKLDLLPSSIELFGMDLKIATQFGHSDIQAKIFLKHSLEHISSNYDFIFIDCPPNLYLATQNGLFASDSYVIVALAEYLSTIGISHIQKSVVGIFDDARIIAKKIGGEIKTPKLVGIIFNRLRYATGGTSSEESTVSGVEKLYDGLVFNTKIPQSTKISERPEQKIPISLSGYKADAVYEERMEKAAEEFYERITRP